MTEVRCSRVWSLPFVPLHIPKRTLLTRDLVNGCHMALRYTLLLRLVSRPVTSPFQQLLAALSERW